MEMLSGTKFVLQLSIEALREENCYSIKYLANYARDKGRKA
jgi:hypothetical protein